MGAQFPDSGNNEIGPGNDYAITINGPFIDINAITINGYQALEPVTLSALHQYVLMTFSTNRGSREVWI